MAVIMQFGIEPPDEREPQRRLRERIRRAKAGLREAERPRPLYDEEMVDLTAPSRGVMNHARR